MVRKFLLSALCLTGLCLPVAAETLPNSGDYYRAACRSLAANTGPTPSELVLPSLGCAIEIEDLASMGRLLTSNSRICKPVDVSVAQTATVVSAFLDAHPDRLKEPFVVLATTALQEKWPCS
ncbi:Rap1a/Tai family immunity protein [Labrys portucalensis]|uniref:Rap1a/Tai family immunity protein n=1 Tax=Labrys neptuniae TaxID=376174 RepID=A0ABV3PVI0_9HYPH|nr:Rap1a/Tai family immunity protein [Labrys neptuniae]MDT3382162.1 Rap1a/Tai family immunity protein [Labrys neptuniae]